MNVSQIKALTWLTAAVLGGLLGWTIYDRLPEFRARANPEGGHPWAAQERATRILNSVTVPEEAPLDRVPQAKIQRHFLDLNWTGKPVLAPVAVVEEERPPERPPVVPVEDLVRIVMISEDRAAPERSFFHLIYKPAAGMPTRGATPRGPSPPAAAAPAGRGAGARGVPAAAPMATSDPSGVDALRRYKSGDTLDRPLDFIRVERITAAEGVTFSFTDSDRQPETVSMKESGLLEGLLVRVSPENAMRPTGREQIPAGDRRAAFGERTARVGENMYRLGFEDMEVIGRDYPSIISSEVSHRRWVDPTTKQPGILLTRVQPGGVAAKHGLREGDVIKSINGHPVGSPQEAITFVKNNADNYSTWSVVIENMGQERVVVYESP